MFNKLITFLKEVKTEFLKVRWPTKDELSGLTVAVIVATILSAIFIGGADYIFYYLLKILLR
ncbi:preprotein translocase subunit SecE [bacterium]|nr:preprotein translocase subunit SecE [bacterium]